MLIILTVLLVVSMPVAAFCSLLAGLKIRRHNRLLAGVVLTGVTACVLLMLWEMRYNIGLFRALMFMGKMPDFYSVDLSDYFPAVCGILFAALLVARLRWKEEYGSTQTLTLALLLWLMAGISFLLLGTTSFAH